jgi:hypothetical protein
VQRVTWSAYFRSQANLCRFVAGGLNVTTDVEHLERMALRYDRIARAAESHRQYA